ncbi:MAG: hypothetical protein AAF697_07285 [Pseudomonadota bacterium]
MKGDNLSQQLHPGEGEFPPDGVPFGGSRAEANQRLQVGFFGIGAMILLVGLASIIGNQADRTQESAVPEAAPTTEPTEAPPQRDPLADAGILPDIPVEPEPSEDEGQVEDLPDPVIDDPEPVEGDDAEG